MSFHFTSFCLLFLSLQIRDGCTVEAATLYGASGENILFPCLFHSFRTLKILCRETCEGENLIIRTSDDTAQSGRYTIKYIREASRTYSVLSVSISEVTQSDSGLYRCGLGDSLSSASYQDFRLVVAEAVLDGNKDHHFYKEPGSSLTVVCSFGSSGRTKSFCRGGCREEEVLVQTDGDRAQRGRNSIEYDAGPASGAVLLVTITHLTQSDSGRYSCRMDKTLLVDLFRDFSITVTEGVDPSTSTPTTAHRFISISSNFTHLRSFKISNKSVHVQDNRKTSSHNVPLIVGLTLAITAVLFSAALLVSCRRRSLRASSLVQSTAPHGTVAVVCSTDMENRGSSSGSNIEKVTYNNPAVKDSSYQKLSSDTRDQNQIYCTLTVSQE